MNEVGEQKPEAAFARAEPRRLPGTNSAVARDDVRLWINGPQIRLDSGASGLALRRLMDKILEQKLVEVISQLQAGAVQAAQSAKLALPKLTEVALRTVQWDGAWHLILGAGLLLFACIPYRIGWACWRRLKEAEPDTTDPWSSTSSLVPSAFFAWAVALILLVASGSQLFNMWNWVAIMDPQAALAHKIFVAIQTKMASG